MHTDTLISLILTHSSMTRAMESSVTDQDESATIRQNLDRADRLASPTFRKAVALFFQGLPGGLAAELAHEAIGNQYRAIVKDLGEVLVADVGHTITSTATFASHLDTRVSESPWTRDVELACQTLRYSHTPTHEVLPAADEHTDWAKRMTVQTMAYWVLRHDVKRWVQQAGIDVERIGQFQCCACSTWRSNEQATEDVPRRALHSFTLPVCLSCADELQFSLEKGNGAAERYSGDALVSVSWDAATKTYLGFIEVPNGEDMPRFYRWSFANIRVDRETTKHLEPEHPLVMDDAALAALVAATSWNTAEETEGEKRPHWAPSYASEQLIVGAALWEDGGWVMHRRGPWGKDHQ